jgi:hypothetical protein
MILRSKVVILSSSQEWMELIRLFNGVLVQLLDIQSLFLRWMESCTLLNPRTVGIGQNMVSKETPGLNGRNGPEMLDSVLPFSHSPMNKEPNST